MLEKEVLYSLLAKLDQTLDRNEATVLTELKYSKDFKVEMLVGKDKIGIMYLETRVYGINDLGKDDSQAILDNVKHYIDVATEWFAKNGATPKPIDKQLTSAQKNMLIGEAALQISRTAKALHMVRKDISPEDPIFENLIFTVNTKGNLDDLLELAERKLSKHFGIKRSNPLYIYIQRIIEAWRRMLLLASDGDEDKAAKYAETIESDEIIKAALSREMKKIRSFIAFTEKQ